MQRELVALMTIKFIVIGSTIRCHYQKLKTDSFYDANFVVTGVLKAVIMKTLVPPLVTKSALW